MMTLRFSKAVHFHGFITVIMFAVSLSMGCGRSDMLAGPDDDVEAVGDAGAAGRSGGATSASLGGAGTGGGGKSSVIGGASTSFASVSKPVGSGGSGGSAGKSTVMISSSTKPGSGAGAMGGVGGAVGGVSTVAGSKATGGAVGGVSAVAGSKATGGTSAIGGSTSTAICIEAKSCGGDVVGTWDVTSSCLTMSGQMDMSAFGLGCSRATVEGSLQTTGLWIAKANGVYSDKTVTTGNLQISLPASCLKFSGTTVRCKEVSSVFMSLGFSSIFCTEATGGGCACPATIKQSGSMGIISLDPWSSGVYETNGNVLVIDSTNHYGYCVSGTQMTLTPQSKNPPMTGAIVFQKQ